MYELIVEAIREKTEHSIDSYVPGRCADALGVQRHGRRIPARLFR